MPCLKSKLEGSAVCLGGNEKMGTSRVSMGKRLREQKQLERKQEKEQRRAQRRAEKQEGVSSEEAAVDAEQESV